MFGEVKNALSFVFFSVGRSIVRSVDFHLAYWPPKVSVTCSLHVLAGNVNVSACARGRTHAHDTNQIAR